MKKLAPLFILISSLFIACDNSACSGTQLSPIAPSGSGSFPSNDSTVIQEALSRWSPYINVQPTAQALDAYKDSLSLLKKAGKLQGVRITIVRQDNLNNLVVSMINSLGAEVEILGIIDNYYLFDPNIEQRIDEIFAAYPQIHYFQVGNEITTILPPSGPTMTTEEYMPILKRIYNHVQQTNYPGRARKPTLLTYSTLGSGLRGPTELEKMVNLGLTEMSPDNIIIAINSYDPANTNEYLGILSGPLRSYRVWITESGIDNPNLQISYVANNYQKLRDYLRAERIYWYVMWDGDGPMEINNFSLIRNVGNYPNYWKSPLLQALIGSR